MKKILVFLLIFICVFSLVGCEEKKPDPNDDKYATHKKILALLNDYNVFGTNGFDYSIEQKLNGIIVNSHTISIRLDNTSDTIGSRVEFKKNLNEDISIGQYTEVTATSYYKNNKIATYVNDAWVWKNCTLEEFATTNIDSFNFDINLLNNLDLLTSGKYEVLSFKIDDLKASSFMGISGNIKNLNFEIKTESLYSKLVSLTVNYSQELTSTYFSFIPYNGSVNVDIPK